MSAIFGCFNTDGSPIDPFIIQEMKRAILHFSHEKNAEWLNDSIGLGQLLTYNTPEAKYEKQPFTDVSGNLVLVSSARIDNRDELYKMFGFPVNELSTIPDSRFIMEAYKKWGKDCVDHLFGDWAFAIWDKQKKEFFVARDHHGNTGLFYYHSNNKFFFSSSIKSLLALKEIPKKMNELFVTKVLVSWPRDGEETAYENIYRLPPAHHLIISANKFDIKRYWYLEHTPLLHLNSAEEYYERFLELYKNAVKVRLRSEKPVAATLSGGLDSGSVCALAAEELKKQGKRLQCYSSVPNYDIGGITLGENRFGDETPFIMASANYIGSIDVQLLKSENISVLDGIYKQLEAHNEPVHAAGNYYWMTEILQKAKADNIGTMLIGQGGNATISWSGMPEALSIKDFIIQYKKGNYLLDFTLKNMLRMLTPIPIFHFISNFNKNNLWKLYTAIRKDYAVQISLEKIMKNNGHIPYCPKYNNALEKRFSIIKPGVLQAGSLHQNNGSQNGIEVRDPTYDKRLMEFCISVPDVHYFNKKFDRYLIRKSMEGRLPKKVLWNKNRGRQAADLIWKVNDKIEDIYDILAEFEKSKLISSILDIPKMKSVAKDVKEMKDKQLFLKVFTILLRGLEAGIFIDSFEKKNFYFNR